MKLSIIVPVYNMEQGNRLSYCLDSLLGQTLQESYEIIAVDDGSKDRSPQILQEYQQRFPERIRIILLENNLHQGGARNQGMEIATGEWIGFMDADDWADPQMFEKLLEAAGQQGADMAGCDYQMVSEQACKPGKVIPQNDPECSGELTKQRKGMLIRRPGSMVVKIYRSEVIRKYGLSFPEHMYYEDNCAAPIWYLHFERYAYVQEPLYYYYQHEASTVHSITEKKSHDRMDAMDLMISLAGQSELLKEYRDDFEYSYTKLYYVNTLFGYMLAMKFPKYSVLKRLQRGMKQNFPQFTKNPYYKEAYDREQIRMMRLHQRCIPLFVIYFKALQIYRALRTGKRSS